jgi:hypothetical protein
MAVVSTTTVQVKPDRFQEWLDQMRKAKAIMDKTGANNIRVLVGLVAGQTTGTILVTSETDDFAGAGTVMDKSFADPEIQKILTLGDAGPMAGFQTSLFVDVPLCHGSSRGADQVTELSGCCREKQRDR